MKANPAVPILRFLGATGTVTGSRFLLETPHTRVLIDCGLFQGLKPLRLRNWSPFPVDPSSIDAVVLTHAHLDHSGYLPALAKQGFRGPVYATAGTETLARIVLPDSAHIQEEDASYANRKGFSKHSPALPLYTGADAERVLGQFRPVTLGQPVTVAKGVTATFRSAGHILGSATVTLTVEGKRPRTILFSGDLGRPHHPIFMPPEDPPAADLVVVESTYGDRAHEDVVSLQRFEDAIVRTATRGGTVVIPSFAVDRTEVLLMHLRRLIAAGRIPSLPVYVDSPMALATLGVYRRAITERSSEIRPEILAFEGDPFDPGRLIEARTVQDSIAIANAPAPKIIISASGMASGGRVLHHLAHHLPDPYCTVLLVGYQAAGTRGRSLADGCRELKLLGRYIGVRAEVVSVPAFSVHADRGELLGWLRRLPRPPETVFVVHGEPPAATALHDAIEHELGWTAAVPRDLEKVRVD